MSKTTKTSRCRYIPDREALEKLQSSLRSTKKKSSSLGKIKLPSCRGVPVEIQPKHDRAYCSFRKKRCGLRKTKKSSNSSSSSSSHSYRQSYKTGQVLNMTYPYTGFDWAENSCYLAAIVQLILHQDPLVDFITDKPTSYPTISILQELLTIHLIHSRIS